MYCIEHRPFWEKGGHTTAQNYLLFVLNKGSQELDVWIQSTSSYLIFFRAILIFSCHLYTHHASGFFPSSFRAKIVCVFVITVISATCFTSSSIWSSKYYMSTNYEAACFAVICILLFPPSYICKLFLTPSSQTPSIFAFPLMWKISFHTHNVQSWCLLCFYVLIFTILGERWEDKIMDWMTTGIMSDMLFFYINFIEMTTLYYSYLNCMFHRLEEGGLSISFIIHDFLYFVCMTYICNSLLFFHWENLCLHGSFHWLTEQPTSHPVSLGIPCLLWNPKVHYSVHKSLPL
jgi:hypothetical protein